jgi:hypothetical protein
VEYKFDPIMVEADIQIVETTDELRKSVASIMEFPEDKTPDLLFFSGIFVSSGGNLNNAYFLPSEMVKAAPSIDHKALDIEHAEDQIVGHIYSSKFIDKTGSVLDVNELASMDSNELNKVGIDVIIAGILYKSRFPELAKEVADGRWKLSMETYYQDYDIKIGDVIMSRKEAEALGIASQVIGKVAKILGKGKEISSGTIMRVLRDLLFSGCGLVKNPANLRSIILETAEKQADNDKEADIIIDLDKKSDSQSKVEDTEEADISVEDVRAQTSVGICVSYKKRVVDATYEGPDAKVIHTDWCTLYDKACSSSSRDVTDPNCLRRVAERQAKNYTESRLKELKSKDKRNVLLSELKDVLKESKK